MPPVVFSFSLIHSFASIDDCSMCVRFAVSELAMIVTIRKAFVFDVNLGHVYFSIVVDAQIILG